MYQAEGTHRRGTAAKVGCVSCLHHELRLGTLCPATALRTQAAAAVVFIGFNPEPHGLSVGAFLLRGGSRRCARTRPPYHGVARRGASPVSRPSRSTSSME